MSVISRTYNTTPGEVSIIHPSLFAVTILGVKRQGLGYTKVVVSPVGLQYLYSISEIFFDPLIPFEDDEKIWVLIEN